MEDFRHKPRTAFEPVADMSEDAAAAEAEALRDGITYHDRKYYIEAEPVVSDRVYDTLFARLQELEEAFPELGTPNSPTRRVGAPPVEELARVEHAAPMLSLDAAIEREKIADFDRYLRERIGADEVDYVVEPKFDGTSVEAVYEDGRFVRGATRGDGEAGEDITHNMRTIGALPLRLAGAGVPGRLAVRGEIFMHRSDFQALNRRRIEAGRSAFANPRNAAAGAVRRLDPREVADYPLDIVFYDLLDVEGGRPESHWQEIQRLREWGFKTDPRVRRCRGFDAVADYHEAMAEKRDDLDYEIDGIVLKLDDVTRWDGLGTRRRSPRWAMAWKFAPREEETRLADIVVQVGTSGILTPVALLDPVEVGGVTVARASLHNEQQARSLDVRPGDTVRIHRAGDVIPEVVERVRKGKDRPGSFRMPEACPSCGSAVAREGAYAVCPAGLACPAQMAGRIEHFASREALDIEGLGDRTVAQLLEAGLVADLADLYALSVDDVKALPGFAEKSAENLIAAIDGAREPRLDQFLTALAIRHVGADAARCLARRFGSLEALREASVEDIAATEGIGETTAASVRAFFERDENRRVLDRLAKNGLEVRPMPKAEEQPLSGLTFVFTGSLERFTRDEAERLVEDRGAHAASSVSGNTDYLVAGPGAGQKRDAAEEHEDVEVLDEEAFITLLRNRGIAV